MKQLVVVWSSLLLVVATLQNKGTSILLGQTLSQDQTGKMHEALVVHMVPNCQ